MVKVASFKRFQEERERGSILHNSDLQRLMVEEANKINFPDFKVKKHLSYVIMMQ